MSTAAPVLSNPQTHFSFDVICSEKSLAIFVQAQKENCVLPRFDHIWTILSVASYLPFILAGKIIAIATNLIVTVVSLYRYEGNNALHFLSRAAVIHPLLAITTTVSTAIRVVAALTGLMLPSQSVYGFQLAEELDTATLQYCHNLSQKYPATENYTTFIERDITPSNATSYFGQEKALELYLRTKSREQLDARELEIKNRISQFVSFCITQDRPRLETMLFFHDIKYHRDIPNLNPKLQPILEKLFKTSPTIISAGDKIPKLLTLNEAKEVYNHMKTEIETGVTAAERQNPTLSQNLDSVLQTQLSETAPYGLRNPNNPLNNQHIEPQMTAIRRLIAEQSSFGLAMG